MFLERARGCGPDAGEVKCLRKAVVMVVVVQYVNAGVLCRGCDQRICEGNTMLPGSIRGEVS
jgi:hypothetical protein